MEVTLFPFCVHSNYIILVSDYNYSVQYFCSWRANTSTRQVSFLLESSHFVYLAGVGRVMLKWTWGNGLLYYGLGCVDPG